MEQETKISELTALPGNLSPTALLAIVQGGVTYHATGEQVSNMVLGNISVMENTSTGQWSARIPVGASGGIQIDWNPACTVTRLNDHFMTPTALTANFLRPFPLGVKPLIELSADAGDYEIVTRTSHAMTLMTRTGTDAATFLVAAPGIAFPAGAAIHNNLVVAVGRY